MPARHHLHRLPIRQRRQFLVPSLEHQLPHIEPRPDRIHPVIQKHPVTHPNPVHRVQTPVRHRHLIPTQPRPLLPIRPRHFLLRLPTVKPIVNRPGIRRYPLQYHRLILPAELLQRHRHFLPVHPHHNVRPPRLHQLSLHRPPLHIVKRADLRTSRHSNHQQQNKALHRSQSFRTDAP